MKKEELLRLLVEQNDTKLKRTEGRLQKGIDKIYKEAVSEAFVEFHKLENVDPEATVDSEEVQKIIDKVWKAFTKKFEELAEPIQKETLDCYDEGIEETSLVVASGENE